MNFLFPLLAELANIIVLTCTPRISAEYADEEAFNVAKIIAKTECCKQPKSYGLEVRHLTHLIITIPL